MSSQTFVRAVGRSPSVLLVTCLALAPLGACGDDETADVICFVSESEAGRVLTCDDGTTVDISDGTVGADGATCVAEEAADGTVTVTCDDGTSATVEDGEDGRDCSVVTEANGGITITCSDGTTATADGADACTVSEDEEAGTVTVACDDGTEATIRDGAPGAACAISDTADGITITCDDGTVVNVGDGSDCAIAQNDDGDVVIACDDGTEITVTPADDRVSTIAGRVLYFDRTDHSDITVTLTAPDGSELQVVTAADGEYSFADIAVASYMLTFEADGYNTETLTGVPAVPGTVRVGDVILRYDVQVEPAGEVFIIDVCSEGDGASPGPVVYLEEPEEIFINGAVNIAAQQAGGCGAEPGSFENDEFGVQGRLVYFDPTSGTTHTLGEDVWAHSVVCSPDGQAVAFLTDADPLEYEGDLHAWWNGMTDAVQLTPDEDLIIPPQTKVELGPASLCGLSFSPESDSLAYLMAMNVVDVDPGFPNSGTLALYQRDDDENLWLASNVRCGFVEDYFEPPAEPGRGRDPVEDFHWEYEYAPDGSSIQYLNDTDGDEGEHKLFQLNLDGTDPDAPLHLVNGVYWNSAAYSPDGSLVAYQVQGPQLGGVGGILLNILDIADSTPGEFDEITVSSTSVPPERFLGDPVATRFFMWSPDGTRLLFVDDLEVEDESQNLEYVDVPAEISGDSDPPAPNLIALDVFWQEGFGATIDPSSSVVLYTVEDRGGDPPCTGEQGEVIIGGILPPAGYMDLCFFDLTSGERTQVSDVARGGPLEASFREDGSAFVWADYPDILGQSSTYHSALNLYDLGEPDALARTVLDDGPYNPDSAPNFNVLWAPDGESLVYLNDNSSTAVLHNLGAYELGGDNTDIMVALESGLSCADLPFQYRNDGGAVLGLYLGGDLDLAEVVAVEDPFPAEVSRLELSDRALFASYAADGTSVAILEANFDDGGYDLIRWDGPEEDDSVVIESGVDIDAYGFAFRQNTAAYGLFELFFPASLRNGAHYSVIP